MKKRITKLRKSTLNGRLIPDIKERLLASNLLYKLPGETPIIVPNNERIVVERLSQKKPTTVGGKKLKDPENWQDSKGKIFRTDAIRRKSLLLCLKYA